MCSRVITERRHPTSPGRRVSHAEGRSWDGGLVAPPPDVSSDTFRGVSVPVPGHAVMDTAGGMSPPLFAACETDRRV